MRISHVPIDTPTCRRVAVAADVDPRTVVRVLAGERVRPTMRRRVLAALAALGVAPTPPTAARLGEEAEAREETADVAGDHGPA